MNETQENIDQQFFTLMEEQFEEQKCQSENCANGIVVCSVRPVARVAHMVCRRPEKLLCLNAYTFITKVISATTCRYCLHDLDVPVPAHKCWVLTPL
jgi:hypothetical protein